jgi:hydroxymethylglutaryl-CoA lyase
MEQVTIIECPRDAWQGLTKIIPTEEKVAYLRQLLRAGFRHLDAVSFVSPKYVPQMADSEAVMERLNAEELPRFPGAEIIGIVVNERGLQRALATPGVTTIGYPYSISERFTRQNANMTQEQLRELVQRLHHALEAEGPHHRQLVVYISMAFGNPYGDPWEPALVAETLAWLSGTGVHTVSLADTVGQARPQDVAELFQSVASYTGAMEIGVHLHSRPEGAAEKILAAYDAGCRRFDSALTGLGGCPFAGDELVGNIPTEAVLGALAARGVDTGISSQAFEEALTATEKIRRRYAH